MPASRQDDICLCAALRRASRAATRLYDEAMKESGLKITQFSLLRNIGRAGTINVTDLSKRMDLERTAMGRNLDVLERKRFIKTVGSREDQRERAVALTKEGERVRDAAVPVWRRAQSQMKRRFGEGGFDSLARALRLLYSEAA